MKDYQDHVVATLFGQVTVRLPRFRCATCGGSETGIAWPPHCRSTPELDRLQAHLSAVMTYRTAADLLEQVFPVDAAKHPETLRRHTLKAGEALAECAAIQPETPALAVVVTLTQPSYGAAGTESGIWRCGSAMSKRRLVAGRFSAPSRKPIQLSKG